jgi:hypothetical protein
MHSGTVSNETSSCRKLGPLHATPEVRQTRTYECDYQAPNW